MADETAAESRVSMNWPNDLKAAVREKVGSRGLTDYTLQAVREKLAGGGAAPSEDLRPLVQRMADAIAFMGDYPDTQAIIEGLGLPEWVDQSTYHWKVLEREVAQREAEEAQEEAPAAPAASPAEPVATDPAPAEQAPGNERGEAVFVDAPPTLGVSARFSSSSEVVEELLAKARAMGVKAASELPSPVVPDLDRPVRPEEPGTQEASVPPEPGTEAAPVPPQPAEPPAPRPAPAIERDLDEFDAGF